MLTAADLMKSRPFADDTIEIIDDLDRIVETVMCSCDAGDHNPY